jgi:hypothetical protein
MGGLPVTEQGLEARRRLFACQNSFMGTEPARRRQAPHRLAGWGIRRLPGSAGQADPSLDDSLTGGLLTWPGSAGSRGDEAEERLFETGLSHGDVGDGVPLRVERPDGGIGVGGAEGHPVSVGGQAGDPGGGGESFRLAA